MKTKTMYILTRQKQGSLWKTPDTVSKFLFKSENRNAVEKFLEDDIADMTAKWPELGDSEKSEGDWNGYYRTIGCGDFSIRYSIINRDA